MPERFRAVQGAPCWLSLMASDLESAQDFYGKLFDWQYREGPVAPGHDDGRDHGRYVVALTDGVPTVGLGSSPSRDLRIPVLWTTYFAAGSADDVARRAQEHGGTVAVGPINFGVGRVAWAADPLGAAFGIWEGDLSSSWWADRRMGAPVWLELRTDDVFAAALYYGAVFRWDSQDNDRLDVRYEDDRVILEVEGRPVASLTGGAAEGASEPYVRPRWHVHFCVDDTEAVCDRAQALGGAIVESPHDSRFGRVATLRDTQGGIFSIASGADADGQGTGNGR